MTSTAGASASPGHSLEILLVDNAAQTPIYAEALRHHYGVVTVTAHQRTALQYLQRAEPVLVVAGMTLEDGSAVDICRAAKLKPLPPSVLVMTRQPERVPDALVAGCDGVLLKPLPASLVVNRAARLLRARADHFRLQSARGRYNVPHRFEGTELPRLGSNRVWPTSSCPHCSHQGVTSFDHADHRRSWYACLQCKKVWMAKRLEK